MCGHVCKSDDGGHFVSWVYFWRIRGRDIAIASMGLMAYAMATHTQLVSFFFIFFGVVAFNCRLWICACVSVCWATNKKKSLSASTLYFGHHYSIVLSSRDQSSCVGV